jgi:hypothetical protein
VVRHPAGQTKEGIVRRVRTTAALFVAATAVAFTAACGGGSGDSSGNGQGTSGSGGGGGNNAFAAYVQCLQKNGVTITMPSFGARNRPSGAPGEGFPRGGMRSGQPRPSGSRFPGGGFGFGMQKPAGVDDATWQKAQTACASLRPTGRPGNGGRGQNNAAFQNCMKDHGVTITEGQRLDPNDAKVKKALETCRVLQQARPSATPTA